MQPAAASELRFELLQDQLRQQHPGRRVGRRAPEVRTGRADRLGQPRSQAKRHAHDAPSSFAVRARSDAVGSSPRASISAGFAPSATSSSCRAMAIVSWCRPPRRLRPGSIATTLPSIDARACRSSSSSRTSARLGPVSWGRMRSSVAIACGPAIPSTSSPTFRWNSRSGAVGVGSEQSVLAPRVEPERVQLALERPHVVAAEVRGVQVQGPVAQPVAGLDQLSPGVGPDRPVDAEVPRSWNARTAASVDAPNVPSSSASSTIAPSSLSRCWMSRTSGPSSPRR